MIIRKAAPSDFSAIRVCIDAAFGQPDEGKLVDALRETDAVEAEFVAEIEGEIIGHALMSRLVSPANSLGLAPLSVHPAHQRKGVGAALMWRAIDDARGSGAAAIFLLGSPKYYSRFGFSVEAAAKFMTVYPKEYMMALALRPSALDGLFGDIVYAPPFSAFG
jgi:putative acetyltransferase